MEIGYLHLEFFYLTFKCNRLIYGKFKSSLQDVRNGKLRQSCLEGCKCAHGGDNLLDDDASVAGADCSWLGW